MNQIKMEIKIKSIITGNNIIRTLQPLLRGYVFFRFCVKSQHKIEPISLKNSLILILPNVFHPGVILQIIHCH